MHKEEKVTANALGLGKCRLVSISRLDWLKLGEGGSAL